MGATKPNQEAAVPGSYGERPRGYRLPENTRLGPVSLQIADLERSLDYYQRTLGLRVLRRDATTAVLGPAGEAVELVELHQLPGASPAPRRGRLGLYHFAILLPDRASLARFVQHLAGIGTQAGASDHLVSEALYLQDPDGLGIEVYADRPRSTWRRVGRQLMMATDPIDFPALQRAGGNDSWNGIPAGTVIGHVHLHVGDLSRASAFFSETLGFDRMIWDYPGALFLGAGGYHHHLGVNTWAGGGAEPASANEARLLEWTIELPDWPSVAAAAESLGQANVSADRDVVVCDPWGTQIRLRAAP